MPLAKLPVICSGHRGRGSNLIQAATATMSIYAGMLFPPNLLHTNIIKIRIDRRLCNLGRRE